MHIGARSLPKAAVAAVGAALALGSGCQCDDGCGVPEVCNGRDDDCDGLVDDLDPDLDPTTATAWYLDGDGDGAGYGEPIAACDAPSGHVVDGGDCDDANAEVHPGAIERCGEVDDDCDGLLDSDPDLDLSGAATYYEDADGDGFGDPNTGTRACDQPPGLTADNTDCDDTTAALAPVDLDLDGVTGCDGDCEDSNPAVYPGAPEQCGEDLDCDPSWVVAFGLPVVLSIQGAELAAADLDQDGNVDLVSSAPFVSTGTLLWYPGLGDGTFAEPQELPVPTGAGPWGLTVADLDDDGDQDVIVAFQFHGTVSWYQNLGGGSFAGDVAIAGADVPREVVPADLDGDGDLDLVFLTRAPTVGPEVAVWWENLGGVLPGPVREIGGTGGASAFDVADLDLDGDLDLLDASFTSDRVWWFENRGTGKFAPQLLGTGGAAIAARPADFDLDGLPDVAVGFKGDDTIAWYRNQGGGTFGAATNLTTTANNVQDLAVVDLDGDGDPDLVATTNVENQVLWHENLGGTFGPEQVVDPDCDGAGPVVVADFNGDRRPDLAAYCYEEFSIRVYTSVCE